MKRTLYFKGRVGQWDIPSFAYTDNEPLKVSCVFDFVQDGRYVATFVCGDQKYIATIVPEGFVELPTEFIQKGGYEPVFVALEIRSKATDKVIVPSDVALGGFCIEPLFVETVQHNTEMHAWFNRIENTLAALDNRLKVAEERLGEYREQGVPLVAEENYVKEENLEVNNNEI